MKRIQLKQLTSDNTPAGHYISSDGLGNFILGNVKLQSGSTFPSNPNNGDVFYSTNDNLLYYYDSTRGIWLSTAQNTIQLGSNSIKKNASGYLANGNSSLSSTNGILMFKNGTLLSASVINDNIMTSGRNVEIRINNSTVNRVIIPMNNVSSNYITNLNLKFNNGDMIQGYVPTGNEDFTNLNVVIVYAYRD